MQWIKGPDFPIGGVIMGTEGIIDAYTTGRGSVPVRGDAVIEQLSGTGRQTRMAIIVTSLPYMIGPEAFAKRVAELVREEKLSGISDVNDETDRNGIRVVMELRRDAHPEVVLNNLYKHTQLQQSFPVNTLALIRTYATGSSEAAFQPATLCLADLLQEFQDHRIEVITRRTRYFLKKAEDRAHILEGYLKALTNIDKVIATIRAASGTEEARTALMAQFQLDEPQANAILEMQLRRLTGLERGKIEKEFEEQNEKIAEFKKILSERQLVLDIIKKELLEIRHKYGGDKDPRRTRIEGSYEQLSSKDLTPNEPMAIFITKQDYIKRMPLDTFKRQRRNTRGVTGVKTKEEDDLQHFFSASMHDRLLVFTTKGSVYSLEVMDLPEGGRTARGTALVNLLSIGQEESVTAVIPVATFSEDSYLIMLTRQAYIKKVQMSELANIRRSGIISITLNDGDELGWVRPSTGKADVLIGTGDGMCIRYSEDELRPMGRTARGVRAITLRDGDTIVGFDVIEPGTEAHVLVVTTDGFGKRVKLDEFRQQGRGGIGLIGTKFKNAQSRLATLRLVSEAEEVMIATLNGIVVRQNVAEISIQGRMATGVRIQQLGEDDQVMSVTPLVEPDPDATIDPADGAADAPAAE
jgi:DNA gyrase subunit A